MTKLMKSCDHCGTAFEPRHADDKFCCRGCEFVSASIKSRGLDRYYELKQNTIAAPVRSRPFEDHDWSWLESAARDAEKNSTQKTATLDCTLSGISCIGCVWLVERIFAEQPGSLRASANPASGSLHLEWLSGTCDLPTFARELASFGYIMSAADANQPHATQADSLTSRLGLCGAFALNAMAFSLPDYLGMPDDFEFAPLFRLIAFASASLSMLAGGSIFIGRALRAAKARTPHIDLPIALGLIIAYLTCVAGIITGEKRLMYFDFVSTFVFLMLLGRHVQRSAVDRNRRRIVRQSPVSKEVDTSEGAVAIESLPKGSTFTLPPGKALPFASCLRDAPSEWSLEWIHGEPEPVRFAPGSHLPAGAILLSNQSAQLTSEETWSESMLSRLVTTPAERSSPLFERMLGIYLPTVILIGIATFAWWLTHGNWLTGLQAMVSIFIVSCPCALGVTIPLANQWASSRLANAGAFVRNPTLWSRLRQIRHVVFDKTGTLTLERPELIDPQGVEKLDDRSALALARLTRHSLHPVARTLLEALGIRGQNLLETFGSLPVEENPGHGVSLRDEKGEWFLGKSGSSTELRHNGKAIAHFAFRDTLRPGAVDVLKQLRQRGMEIHLLSGDSPEKTARVAHALGIRPQNAFGSLDPNSKAQRVTEIDRQNTLFVGDGANDSLAFDSAFVTATPVVDRSLLESKADIYSLGSGLHHLTLAFDTADDRATGVRRAFIFAVVYNLAAIGVAATGAMNPLLAAILMPLSSLTSIVLAASGTCRLRRVDFPKPTVYDGPAFPPDPSHGATRKAIRSHAA